MVVMSCEELSNSDEENASQTEGGEENDSHTEERQASFITRCTPKKKHRGPSQGPPVLPEGQKWFICTNKDGQPNKIDLPTRLLVGSIGLQVRETLPIGYDEFEQVPGERIECLINNLEKSYDLRHVSYNWFQKKIRKAWRDWRYKLRKKYIKGKDIAQVRASPTPDFVKPEDWHVFIDISTTPEFEVFSGRNKENRSRLEFPNASGRHSMAQVRHKIATEKNLLDDDEVGRAEAYVAMRSKNGKPDDEKTAKMKALMSSKPETRLTGPNDAVVQVYGKETRGRMRFMGEGVSLNSIRSHAHLVNKLIDTHHQNAENDSKFEKLSKEFESFKDFVTKELSKPCNENINRTRESPSSSASPPVTTRRDDMDKGKRCDLYSWDDCLVARGEVSEVNPELLVHHVAIGEGNYKILVDTVLHPNALLFRRNSQVQTMDDVRGGFTVWPKQFLKF